MAETDALAERTLDLHQIVRNSAVVPTRSRQLKELAAGLGIQKTSDLESGLQAPAIWRRWVERRERHALDAQRAYNETVQAHNGARAEFARSLYNIGAATGLNVEERDRP